MSSENVPAKMAGKRRSRVVRRAVRITESDDEIMIDVESAIYYDQYNVQNSRNLLELNDRKVFSEVLPKS